MSCPEPDSHHNAIVMRDGEPLRDWLVWFAHAVAVEDARQAQLPGSSWCLMLRKEEAHAVVDAANALVQAAVPLAEDAGSP